MRHAFFQLFLHEAEHFLTDVHLSFSFRLVTISSRVLFLCSLFLSDSLQPRSEFLELTAGYTHHRAEQGRHAVEEAEKRKSGNVLYKKEQFTPMNRSPEIMDADRLGNHSTE
jgi:hypothetical protein